MDVTLNVFWIPEEVQQMIADGQSVDVRHFETEKRTFFIIDSISPFEGNFTQVTSHACDFIAKDPYTVVLKKIRDSRKQLMFQDL